MTSGSGRRRVAVIGSGVSGLLAAHVLSRTDDVTLFESDSRLGGHAHTHDVEVDGRTLAVDTGFIVHNERTYPTLLRLFAELGITTQETDMSMSVSCPQDGIEYAGGQGLRGLLPSWRTLGRVAYLRMLGEVARFHRAAARVLASPHEGAGAEALTLGEFLDRNGFSEDFQRWFMTPLVAAVWSCEPAAAPDYPARHLFTFLDHHGMLGVLGSPPWRTVTGGSRAYVEAVAAGLHEIRLGTPVLGVTELADGVLLDLGGGRRAAYDAVVVATHAPQALAMLTNPTDRQRDVLGAFGYQTNVARLHTDTSLLPRHRHARASWNYLVPERDRPGEVVVTYDLTRLQRLTAASGTRLLLTLGGSDLVDPDRVVATMSYAHPLFTTDAVAAQRDLPSINTDRLAFAGAYHGWGFHEDGALSGLRAAERLGGTWEAEPRPAAKGTPASQPMPVLYETTIRHQRTAPVRHAFTHRSYTWLVDLDHLPDHGLLGRFAARDHIGDPERSIRTNIDTFLAAHGVDLAGGTILMLAQARVAGFCFNPITVFWCHDGTGRLAGVVVEVHNTYGDRHAYLVRPDANGRASVDKALYVSPFNDVSGRYRLHLPPPGERLSMGVVLERDGMPPFVTTVRGRALPASRSAVRRLALHHPWEPVVVAARIRWQGVRLWAKRLPVVDRPVHPDQPGAGAQGHVDASAWPDVARVPHGPRAAVAGGVAERLFRGIVRSLDLRVELPDGSTLGRQQDRGPLPLMRVHRPTALFRRVGADGLIGFGESYLAGDWDADDLAAVLGVFAARLDRLVPRPLQRLRAAYVARHPETERNTPEGSRTNIARHYDLSNELFAAFLDPSMTYSGALFGDLLGAGRYRPTRADLMSAQHAKIDRLLDRAGVRDGSRLLEIGTGWGELAIRAARRGAVVRSVTLSREQRDLARARVERAGLGDQVRIELLDYRSVEGRYDAVVSVEMVEAVGLDYLPDYFATIERVLAPGGRVALQAITMDDRRMRQTRHTYTWVHKYVFPGGLIPSAEALSRAAARSGLVPGESFAMGPHYAETLRLWDEEFLARWPEVARLGFDEVFRRMWHFYLCYSRAGFDSGYLDVQQLVLTRAHERAMPLAQAIRASA